MRAFVQFDSYVWHGDAAKPVTACWPENAARILLLMYRYPIFQSYQPKGWVDFRPPSDHLLPACRFGTYCSIDPDVPQTFMAVFGGQKLAQAAAKILQAEGISNRVRRICSQLWKVEW